MKRAIAAVIYRNALRLVRVAERIDPSLAHVVWLRPGAERDLKRYLEGEALTAHSRNLFVFAQHECRHCGAFLDRVDEAHDCYVVEAKVGGVTVKHPPSMVDEVDAMRAEQDAEISSALTPDIANVERVSSPRPGIKRLKRRKLASVPKE